MIVANFIFWALTLSQLFYKSFVHISQPLKPPSSLRQVQRAPNLSAYTPQIPCARLPALSHPLPSSKTGQWPAADSPNTPSRKRSHYHVLEFSSPPLRQDMSEVGLIAQVQQMILRRKEGEA